MNQKTMAIAAVLAATLALLLSTSLASPIKAVAEKINDNGDYDRDHNDRDEKDSKKSYPGDKSETNTEQTLKQKNTGSGASTNLNCGTNNLDTTASVSACGSIDAAALQQLTELPAG